jgi:hypothetical protein
VEALFERATLREPGWYTARRRRTEVLDGTGSSRLYLAYPIAASRRSRSATTRPPDETLDVTSKSVVVYGVGSRLVTRTDGGRFGTVGQARYVEVVYDHQAICPRREAPDHGSGRVDLPQPRLRGDEVGDGGLVLQLHAGRSCRPPRRRTSTGSKRSRNTPVVLA